MFFFLKNLKYVPPLCSVSVPEISSALALAPEAFSSQYGFPKPIPSDPIVTHCKVGGRAAKGAEALKNAGYENVQIYAGSMEDWKKNGGTLIKGGGGDTAESSKSCSVI